ncbi:aspartyl protease family protein [bacterium]|nr:aspartyl protease family protein [bacterium]
MGEIRARLKLRNSMNGGDAVEVEAIVDSGARRLSIPDDLVQKLGLAVSGHFNVKYADGRVEKRPRYRNLDATLIHPNPVINGRRAAGDCVGTPVGSPILLGQLPLEDMDVILNMALERLEPNPESPDSDPLSYLY